MLKMYMFTCLKCVQLPFNCTCIDCDPNPCSQNCTASPVGATCSCEPGYVLVDNVTCVLITTAAPEITTGKITIVNVSIDCI